ncbi:hypothetical protein HQ520_12800 [bacterium]|nr:hypothetical protein [bacterium]
MRTGTSYMGHHNPKHIEADIVEMKSLQLDDVLVSAQENDFVWFPGKIRMTPKIALDHGLRPLAIFWGALNLFGGGRSSQFLLENPEGFQVARDGSHLPAGCYNNPACVGRIQVMIDTIVECGFAGYFVDEPSPLRKCFCPSCRAKYEEWHGGDLAGAGEDQVEAFRRRCVSDYVRRIADYCKANHPALETMCCLMPVDQFVWEDVAKIDSLDNLGTDVYWVNRDNDVEEMTPIVRDMASVCEKRKKIHHEWFQCWGAQRGKEDRIREQGLILVRERPDAVYVWAWKGQVGTKETCEDAEAAWSRAVAVFRAAKEI